ALREPFIGIVIKGISWLSFRQNYRLGGLIGRALYWLPNKLLATTRRNVQACLPELSKEEQEKLIKNSLMETARGFTETAAMWMWPAERVAKLIQSVEGEEHVRAAQEQGKGVIIMTPHIGSWEMVGFYVSTHYPMTTLFREHRIKSLGKIMAKGRSKQGNQPVPADIHGVRALLQALKRGETIGVLPDQDPGYEAGEFAPLFGIDAVTMTLTSKLLKKCDAVVLSTVGERLPNGKGFHIRFSPPVEGLRDPNLHASLVAMNKEVEHQIRLLPEQYLWSYQRFRRRPDRSDQSFYDSSY
ncbi:MAG: lysophospholipid acyltransferase family protein, partial [Gammaproteobacteria bacterium]|nr:lysophospholipid acyltransferase family protein [Gammaproteobacteria bacterium]